MRQIIAYHPTIEVRKESGEVVTIEIGMDDWYTNQEVLDGLLRVTGSLTVGGAVVAIEEGKFNLGLPTGIVRMRVENKVLVHPPTLSVGWSDGGLTA